MEFQFTKSANLEVISQMPLLGFDIKKVFYKIHKENIDKCLMNSLMNNLTDETYAIDGLEFKVKIVYKLIPTNYLKKQELKDKLQKENEFYQNLFKNGTFKQSKFKAILFLSVDENFYEEQIKSLSLKNDLIIISDKDIELYACEPDYPPTQYLEILFENMSGLLVLQDCFNYKNIKWKYKFLKNLGYDIELIFIGESVEQLQNLNELKPEYQLPIDITFVYDKTLESIYNFQSYLKTEKIHLVYNNGVIDDNNINLTYTKYKYIDKIIKKFLDEPIKNPLAKKWIDEELEKRKNL